MEAVNITLCTIGIVSVIYALLARGIYGGGVSMIKFEWVESKVGYITEKARPPWRFGYTLHHIRNTSYKRLISQFLLWICRLVTVSSEVNTFAKFPPLYAHDEQQGLRQDDTPFPRDRSVFEYHGIQAGDVDDRKDRDKPRHYAPEQERIAPGVTSPQGPEMVRFRFHTEETATQVDHFPCQEQSKPSETDKSSAPGFENELTARRDGTVTIVTEVAVAEAENYE